MLLSMRKSRWPRFCHPSYLQSSTHFMLSTEACLGVKHAGVLNAVLTTESVTAIMHLQGCTFVNQYVVVKTLGQGAYGKVKLCLNSEDHNLYALKLVSKVRTAEFTFLLPSCHYPGVTRSPQYGALHI